MNQDKDCDCTELTELYRLRREAERTELACNAGMKEMDLDSINEDDLDFLNVLRDNLGSFRNAARQYYVALDSLAKARKISFFRKEDSTRQEIPYEEIKRLRILHPHYTITINCARCSHEIDVI